MNIEDLRVVANPTLVREHALEKLRGAISAGLYLPGARLVERELCEALGVSRTSVREALRQLQAEGLIEAGPRRAIIVSVLSATDAYDIYTLREMVETHAIRQMVAHGDAKAVKQLQATYKAIEKHAAKGDLPALAEMSGVFYELILDASQSKVVRETGRQLLKRVSYLRLASMSAPQRVQAGLSEWRAVLDAVTAGDADRAATALGDHIRAARETIVCKLRDGEVSTLAL